MFFFRRKGLLRHERRARARDRPSWTGRERKAVFAGVSRKTGARTGSRGRHLVRERALERERARFHDELELRADQGLDVQRREARGAAAASRARAPRPRRVLNAASHPRRARNVVGVPPARREPSAPRRRAASLVASPARRTPARRSRRPTPSDAPASSRRVARRRPRSPCVRRHGGRSPIARGALFRKRRSSSGRAPTRARRATRDDGFAGSTWVLETS